MDNIKNAVAAICTFDVKDDAVLKAFSKFSGSSEVECFEAYGEICRQLLISGRTLGEYLHDMLVYSESEFIAKCAAAPSELQKKAIECDLHTIEFLSQYSAEKLKSMLSDRFDNLLFHSLPDFEQGEFNYTADYFLDFAATHGSGMFARYKAFSFDGNELLPVENTDPIRLSDLKNYKAQRDQVVENTVCFVNRKPAQNVLLYGDRGTGKSSTVKAILNEFDGLRMVEVSKNDVAGLPKLFRMLKNNPLRFIVTIDDLTFAENDDRFGILKAALEGSLSARPENILIYATTNRRKIVKETSAERSGEEISRSDAIDESMSLADRFGLFVTFGKPNKEVYLDIVKQLADDRKLSLPDEELFAAAERFALRRSGRSPRVARQFIDHVIGRIELGLDY